MGVPHVLKLWLERESSLQEAGSLKSLFFKSNFEELKYRHCCRVEVNLAAFSCCI